MTYLSDGKCQTCTRAANLAQSPRLLSRAQALDAATPRGSILRDAGDEDHFYTVVPMQ